MHDFDHFITLSGFTFYMLETINLDNPSNSLTNISIAGVGKQIGTIFPSFPIPFLEGINGQITPGIAPTPPLAAPP